MTPTRRLVLKVGGLIGLFVLGILFYAFVDPSTGVYPQCVFHKVTGLQCPGCGMQRMLNHLFHGEVREAFFSNILLFCALPFILWMIVAELLREKRPDLYAATFSTRVIVVTAVVVILWVIVRNLVGV